MDQILRKNYLRGSFNKIKTYKGMYITGEMNTGSWIS